MSGFLIGGGFGSRGRRRLFCLLAAMSIGALVWLVAGSSSARADSNRHFVGTLTTTSHRVWHDYPNGITESGTRDITQQATVDLAVPPGSTTVAGFTASNVSLNGSTDLMEGPSTCHITEAHSLDTSGMQAPFTISGSFANLAPDWPLRDHRTYVGTCGYEGGAHSDDLYVRSSIRCQTMDDGSTGTVTYDYSYVTHDSSGDETYTCKGTLKLSGVVIDSISPAHGSPVGGKAIIIKGTGFGPAGTKDEVFFCPHNARPPQRACAHAKRVVVHSDHSITAQTPVENHQILVGGSSANVWVVVPTAGGGHGTSANSTVFTYR